MSVSGGIAGATCVVALGIALAPTPVAARPPCAAALPAPALTASSPRYDVAFRPDPAPAVSRHFALDIVVCPKAGAALPATLAVDAHMPAHRHGMNYRPSVTPAGAGRWRAEGLLFHMPGEWEFRFDLGTADGLERATLRQEVP